MATPQDEAGAVLSDRTRAVLANGASGLSDALITHHHKIPFPSTDTASGILDIASIDPDVTNDALPGISSATIYSDSPVGLSHTGQKIGIAQDLSCEIKIEGRDDPISILELARRNDVDGLEHVGLTAAEISHLIQEVAKIAPRIPDVIDGSMKQVYFEAGDQAVLVTPVYPVKFTTELNSRLRRLATEIRAEADDPDNTGIRRRSPRRVGQPVGGANPQNAGYLVSKGSESTRRYAIPILVFTPPSDSSSDATRLLRRLIARGSFAKMGVIDDADLALYGRRSAFASDLSSHRNAETGHASEIVDAFLAPLVDLSPQICGLPPDIWRDPSWEQIPHCERALLDPRLGKLDAARLARHFADHLSNRIRVLLTPRGQSAEHASTNSGFSLSARSKTALEDAFVMALIDISKRS